MNQLLNAVKGLVAPKDCQAIITGETLMLACGLNPDEVNDVCEHGVQHLSTVIDNKVNSKELSDEIFLDRLFDLSTNDLEQLPIPFYATVINSKSFKSLPHDRQNDIFRKIFATLKLPSVEDISKLPPEQVALNYPEYTAIFHAFFALNIPNQQMVSQQDLYVKKVVEQQLQAMVDKAPALRDPAVRASLRATGDVTADAEKALQHFNTTQDLDQNTFHQLNLGEDVEQAVANAKVILAEYELSAYAAAAKHQGIMDAKEAELCTIIDPKEKNNPINQFVKAGKKVLANFTKPQNLAKLGFRQAVTKAVQHFTEGAIPGIGAAVGLAMKLGECGKKIFHDKKSVREVFADAAPDLVRGVVTVGTSFTLLAPLAGTIGTVASTAVKGIAAAHAEGYPIGKDFLQRVGKEFTKKGNLLNLGASVLGATVGVGAKSFINHFRAAGDTTAMTDEITAEITAETVVDSMNTDDVTAAIDTSTVSETNLDYTDAYLAAHPGAHLDANGWVQNADGSYARNEAGQLFGSTDRVFRALKENEMLDKAGNIVSKPLTEQQPVSEKDLATLIHDSVETSMESKRAALEAAIEANEERNFTADLDNIVRGQNFVTEGYTQEQGFWIKRTNNISRYVTDVNQNGIYDKGDINWECGEVDNMVGIRTGVCGGVMKQTIYEDVSPREPDRGSGFVSWRDSKNKSVPSLLENLRRDSINASLESKREALEAAAMQASTAGNLTADTVDEMMEDSGFADSDKKFAEAVRQIEVDNQKDREAFEQMDPAERDAKTVEYFQKITMESKFNSLPTEQQQELIDLKAKAIVAQEQGDTATYQALKKQFEKRQHETMSADMANDTRSARANIKGTYEWRMRETDQALMSEEHFTDIYGKYQGVKDGVPQYVREDGYYKMRLPKVAGVEDKTPIDPQHDATMALQDAINRERAKLTEQNQGIAATNAAEPERSL